jgi:hypothetical protein
VDFVVFIFSYALRGPYVLFPVSTCSNSILVLSDSYRISMAAAVHAFRGATLDDS